VRQREAVWDEHEAIASAIASGDGDTAARLIEEHSASASENLAVQLGVLQSTPQDPRRQP
ncbi:MAG: FCD domain-containing protein, partial [Comamonadaceae bacterium]